MTQPIKIRPRSFSRGAFLVLGLFAMGGLVLWGLFQAPLPTSPAAPTAAEWGVPDRPLRFASYNVLKLQRGLDVVAKEIRAADADFVLLQEVESRDVIDLVAALDMREFHQPRAYYASANLDGPRATWGSLILSRHPIYEAAPIPDPAEQPFGVWAVSVVNGRKFVVASVQTSKKRSTEIASLLRAWHERGSPPMVVGGTFNQDWSEADASAMKESLPNTMMNRFFASAHWRMADELRIDRKGSDHQLIWVTLARP